jgi:uncharacterized membrane protein
MVIFGAILTVVGALLNVLAFFAAPIYGARIKDWWACRSKARIQERIELLEKELSSFTPLGNMVSTLATVIISGIYNMIGVALVFLAIGCATAILAIMFPSGFSPFGIKISQRLMYFVPLFCFLCAIATIIRSANDAGRRLRKLEVGYGVSLKKSLARLRKNLESEVNR